MSPGDPAAPASCWVSYTASATGTQSITATDAGDAVHAGSSGNTAVTVTAAAAGEVDGGGKIRVAGGLATFGFEVERERTGGPANGQLTYQNHPRKLTVHSRRIRTFDIVGSTATFSGDCRKKYDGGPWTACIFSVTATDNDTPRRWDSHEESGRNPDTFTIHVSGEPAEGGTVVRGHIEIEHEHEQGRGRRRRFPTSVDDGERSDRAVEGVTDRGSTPRPAEPTLRVSKKERNS
jgi:hypothetical protein